MLTKTINVQENHANISELLSMVHDGTEIIFTEGATPFARLTPIAQPAISRKAGLHQGKVWVSDDFDEPLPESFWTE